MAIAETVFKKHVLTPVSFKRAVTGLPVIDAPDIDDRGSVGPDFYPVVGITEGDVIRVKIKRESIENNSSATLFAVSSDTSVMTVDTPASGPLPGASEVEIKLKGVSGGADATPKKAKLEVRFSSASGPILNKLDCWVFKPAPVKLAPHLVKIGATPAPTVDIDAVMVLVRAIWRPCGVTFTVDPTRNESITNFANPGVVTRVWDSKKKYKGSELDKLLQTNHVKNMVNIYFIHRIETKDSPLGMGLSRDAIKSRGLTNPGVLMAETDGSTTRDNYWWANDLAHELGHFLQLWHPNLQEPPDEREDSWSRRMLMHNYNNKRDNTWPRRFADGPPIQNYANRAHFNDLGYGNAPRGGFITMKDLSTISTDGECGTSRKTATGPPKKLY